MDPHSKAAKNTSHGNEVLPQDTTHLIQHVTCYHQEVHAKIKQPVRPHENLLTIEKRRKLQWYGHVSHSSGLAKTILQGTVKGGRRQGDRKRDGKTTSGNGQAWTLPKVPKHERALENTGKWRKLVVKLAVLPK